MYLAGYLFPERTLIARIYSRPDDTTTEMWTADVPGQKYLGKNVYILTSRRTFSAAEAAAYHLKAFGRAKVVGDTTGGGAHRINGVDLNDRFVMAVPITRPTNVRTGTDWEGVGVIPDIAVSTERALVTAQLAALRALPTTAERERVIAELEKETNR
jgi:C-terminal processing protease CtpA/Prc